MELLKHNALSIIEIILTRIWFPNRTTCCDNGLLMRFQSYIKPVAGLITFY